MPNSEYSNPTFLSPIWSREGLTKTCYEYLLILWLAPHRVTSSITSMTFFRLSTTIHTIMYIIAFFLLNPLNTHDRVYCCFSRKKYTNCFRHVVNILVGNSIPLPLPHWGIVRALGEWATEPASLGKFIFRLFPPARKISKSRIEFRNSVGSSL